MDDAGDDVLACMGFPGQHRGEVHGTTPLERLSGEIKRRSNVAGIVPNEAAVTRLVGALMPEQNDERAELAKVPRAQRVECQRRASSAPAA